MKFGAPLIQTIVCTSYPCRGDHPCEEERMLMVVVSTMLPEGAAVCHSKLTLLASSSSGAGRPYGGYCMGCSGYKLYKQLSVARRVNHHPR